MHQGRGLLVVLGFAAGGLSTAIAPAVPATASGQVCAGIVIDDGAGTAPVPQGASVPPGSSDLDLLTAAGDTFTQNDSGLVCAINDYPANGLQNCLNTAHGLYYYWSYWEGDPTTNTWTYADVGPAEHSVTAGQQYVEGWRYQDPGPDSPDAAQPSVKPAAAYAQACSGASSTPGGGGTGSGGGVSGSSVTSTTGAAVASPATSTPEGTAGTSAPSAGSGASHPSTFTTPTSSGTRPTVIPGTTTQSQPTTTQGTPARQQTSKRPARKLALANAAQKGAPGGDPALPILLVVVLIGLIGVAAWFKWRRSPVEE
jgi:hypothetical protein